MTSRRPIPTVEGTAPIERGVGPVRTETNTDAAAPADETGRQLVSVPPAAVEPAGPPATPEPGPSPYGPVHLTMPPPQPHPDATPLAEDLLGPRATMRRQQISAHVPEELRLRRRLKIYAIDHEMEVQDVVAIALDQWLRSQDA